MTLYSKQQNLQVFQNPPVSMISRCEYFFFSKHLYTLLHDEIRWFIRRRKLYIDLFAFMHSYRIIGGPVKPCCSLGECCIFLLRYCIHLHCAKHLFLLSFLLQYFWIWMTVRRPSLLFYIYRDSGILDGRWFRGLERNLCAFFFLPCSTSR